MAASPIAPEQRMKIFFGDITRLEADAIVNAANTSLLGGGGVDGAIHRAAGEKLLEECRKLNGCRTGEAKVTSAYNLPGRYVIHAVGPVWKDGNSAERELLASAYLNSLKRAEELHLESCAFSNISTGVYGFPKEEAARVAIETTREWRSKNELPREVIFCIFDNENMEIYSRLLN